MLESVLPSGSRKLVVARNTLAQLVGKIIGAGTTFVVSLVIARQFGAVGYGDFVKVTTYVAFFFLVADFGVNAIYLQKPKGIWGALVGLRVFGSIVLIFLALAILSFLPQGTSQGYTPLVRFGIILFAPAIFFQALITTTNAVFQRELRYGFATAALFCGSAATLAILWLGVRGGLPTAIMVGTLALLVGSIITALVSLGFVSKLQLLTLSFSPKLLRQLLIPAVPLGLTLLFNLVYGHGDSVILTLTRQTTEVGIYGLAYRVFEVPLVIPTFFMNAVYPLLLKAKNDTREIKKLLKTSLLFLIGSSLLVTIGTWIVSPWLTLIQEDFAASVAALRVLSLGLPLFFVSAATMWALIALDKLWLLLGIYGLGMMLNIGLNIWLIPTYGYMAASWVTVVSEGAVLFVSCIVLLKYFHKS